MEVEPGGTYFYGNRLLKTNFWSNEYGRSFDRLYLVSQLVPESHGVRQSEPIVAEDDKPDTWPESRTVTNFPRTEPKTGNDLICIVDLVQNKSSYDGKHVRIHARCTKVNRNIMGRNWVHLQDGTYDAFDLVVTTLSHVQAGSELEIEAKVVLDKDFGSGYYYESHFRRWSSIDSRVKPKQGEEKVSKWSFIISSALCEMNGFLLSLGLWAVSQPDCFQLKWL
jgi:hypothetical protein